MKEIGYFIVGMCMWLGRLYTYHTHSLVVCGCVLRLYCDTIMCREFVLLDVMAIWDSHVFSRSISCKDRFWSTEKYDRFR